MIYAKISTSLFLIVSDGGGGARGILSTHSGSATVPLQNNHSKWNLGGSLCIPKYRDVKTKNSSLLKI